MAAPEDDNEESDNGTLTLSTSIALRYALGLGE
jgi:hypothetical protein